MSENDKFFYKIGVFKPHRTAFQLLFVQIARNLSCPKLLGVSAPLPPCLPLAILSWLLLKLHATKLIVMTTMHDHHILQEFSNIASDTTFYFKSYTDDEVEHNKCHKDNNPKLAVQVKKHYLITGN